VRLHWHKYSGLAGTHWPVYAAILINSGGFTSGVYSFAKTKPIELWSVFELIEKQKKITIKKLRL
jgi:hypothetical protein